MGTTYLRLDQLIYCAIRRWRRFAKHVKKKRYECLVKVRDCQLAGAALERTCVLHDGSCERRKCV